MSGAFPVSPPWRAAPVAKAFARVDPRLCLLLTALLGLLAWKAAAPALCLYLSGLGVALFPGDLVHRLVPGSLKRTLYFALFWSLLKLGCDAGPGFFSALAAGASFDFSGHGVQAAGDAGLLCLRLLTIMGAALVLTALTSARSLGLALTWYIRPIAGKNAWKTALGLALMIQYLPRVHALSGQTRMAARSRGLPDAGFAHWRMALPHMFRLLASGVWKQAVAVAGRHLDEPGAWVLAEPLPFAQTARVLGLALVLILLAF